MKNRLIRLTTDQVAHFYKFGIYLGGLGAGAVFEIALINTSFMVTLKENNIACTYFATRIYIENLSDAKVVEKLDFEEVEESEQFSKMQAD